MSNLNTQTITNNDDDDFWSSPSVIKKPYNTADAVDQLSATDEAFPPEVSSMPYKMDDDYPYSGASSNPPQEVSEDAGESTYVTVDSTGYSKYTCEVEKRCAFLKRTGKTFPDHFIIGINYGDDTEERSEVLPYISKSGLFREEVAETILNGADHEALISFSRTKLPMIRKGEIYTAPPSRWEHYDVAIELKREDYTLLASPSKPNRITAPRGSKERQKKISLALHGSKDALLPIVENYNSYMKTFGSKKETVCLVPLDRIEEYFPCKIRSVHSHANCPYGHARFSEDDAKTGIILTCKPSISYSM